MMAIFILGVAVIALLYMLLFNWKALGALIMGLIGIAVTFAVGFGAFILLLKLLAGA